MSQETTEATYRILDASANRASEGLRTMEEYARFVSDDSAATATLKSMRHDLAAAIARFPRESLLSARDTEADVGTAISEPTETQRTSLRDVIAAAASRVQQSLRVLEEYGKTIDGAAAAQIEQIRYRCYTAAADLEQSVPTSVRRERMSRAHLYVLIDSGADEPSFAAAVTRLCDAGVDVLQLRDRNVDDRVVIRRARLGTEIANERGVLMIVNDRADLALAAGADGVHVGQEELPAAVARQILGADKLVGVSTHDINQARKAVADGADYIGCGPVFAGSTKSFEQYVGTDFLHQVSREIRLPAFAIGGITEANIDQVTTAGCNRVAVTGAIRDADDPASAAKNLRSRLKQATDGAAP